MHVTFQTFRTIPSAPYPKTFSRRARWRVMTEDPGTLRARLDKLAALVELARLSRSEEVRARMEPSIQLVSWALQTVARARCQSASESDPRSACKVDPLRG